MSLVLALMAIRLASMGEGKINFKTPHRLLERIGAYEWHFWLSI